MRQILRSLVVGILLATSLVSPSLAAGVAGSVITTTPTRQVAASASIYYINSKGVKVKRPIVVKEVIPVGASAQCKDNTFSFSQTRRGTCSHHGGVKKWL